MLILKIGGGAAINLEGIADDLARTNEALIIVQGANAVRDELAGRLGVEVATVTSISGQSSTLSDDPLLDLMMMAYAGLANTKLVEMLQQRGVNAIGLSGVDGRVVTARRNSGIRVIRDGRKMLIRDRSGRAADVNKELLEMLLNGGYVPVLTMPLIDEQGVAVNSENDDVVAVLHQRFPARDIIFLIESPGLLRDGRDPSSVFSALDLEGVRQMRRRINGRMGRKLQSIEKVLGQGPVRLTIADGRVPNPLQRAREGAGTVIT